MKKRAFDITVASIGLMLMALPMAVIYAASRFKMGSPVLFRQDRLGKDAESLVVTKFRSLKPETDKQGNKLTEAERHTPFGNILRKGFDELPQLWSVVRGDMSIVGPRPRAFPAIHPFDDIQDISILDVKPGMISPVHVEQCKRGGRLPLALHNKIDGDYARKPVSLRQDFGIIVNVAIGVIRKGHVSTYNNIQEEAGTQPIEIDPPQHP